MMHTLQAADPPLKPEHTPREAQSPVSEQRRIGRPTAAEQQQRTARFLVLAADGVPYDKAAKRAGVKAERALRLLSETGIVQALDAVRAAA